LVIGEWRIFNYYSVKLESVSYHSHGWVAASKPKVLGMVNAGEAIPKLVPAKAGTALEAATLPSYKVKFDRILRIFYEKALEYGKNKSESIDS